MVRNSRMMFGEKPMRIILSAHGIRWSPRASSRNICIGQELRGQRHPGVGIATVANSKGRAFQTAVDAC